MDEYSVIVTPDAEADLIELKSYITDVLLSRETAKNYIQALRKEIGSLAHMPARYKTLDDEPWHSKEIRRTIVKNFYVYYRIDENTKCVFILNVIYSRRDQLRILDQIQMDL